MITLAIECSAGPASCALVEDGRILAAATVNTALTHSQTLLPLVDALLHNAGRTLDAVDRFAVAAGPGSFTGVRIGVAAVKGLAFAQDKPCVGVSTLSAMARLTEGLPLSGIVCPVMDARCGQVYTALFARQDDRLTRLTPDEALPLADLPARWQAALADRPTDEKMVFLLGDGAELCYTTVKDHFRGVVLAPPLLRYQQAVGVAREAETGDWPAVPGAALQPLYLRRPQAERERLRRLQAAE